MTDVFKVGVVIELLDRVSSPLANLSRGFAKTDAAVTALNEKLNRVHSSFNKGLMYAAGSAALAAPIIAASNAARDYLHQINQMNSAGLSQREIAMSTAAAWGTAGKIGTSTALENLKVISDLRTIFGKTTEAIEYMPKFAMMQGAYAGILDGKLGHMKVDSQSFSAAKGLDMTGKVRNRKEFDDSLEKMFKVTEATLGRVLPSDYQSFNKFARQAKYGFNDDFLYKVLPELLLENKTGSGSGGVSGGVGPQLAAFYRFANQGLMNKRSAESLHEMGLIPASSILKTTTSGTTLKGGVLDAKMAGANPLEWVQKVFLPHMEKAYKISPQDTDSLIQRSNQIFKGNQLAASLVSELIKKPQQYERFGKNYEKADSIKQAYKRGIKGDPMVATKRFHAAIENLSTAIGKELTPVITDLTNKLSGVIERTTAFVNQHPNITRTIAGFMAAGSALFAAGAAANFAKAGFHGLSLILGPLAKIKLPSLTAIRAAIGPIGEALITRILPAMGRFGLGLMKLTPETAAVAFAITGLIAAVTNWDKIMDFARNNVDALKIGLVFLIDTGDAATGMFKKLAGAIGDMLNTVGGYVNGMLKGLNLPELPDFSKFKFKVDQGLLDYSNKRLAEKGMLKDIDIFAKATQPPLMNPKLLIAPKSNVVPFKAPPPMFMPPPKSGSGHTTVINNHIHEGAVVVNAAKGHTTQEIADHTVKQLVKRMQHAAYGVGPGNSLGRPLAANGNYQ